MIVEQMSTDRRRRFKPKTPIGRLGVESLLHRAEMRFTNGYCFSGRVEPDILRRSSALIAHAFRKFSYRLTATSETAYAWLRDCRHGAALRIVDCDNLDNAFAELCRDSTGETDDGTHAKMVITLLRSRCSDDFVIAQTCDHAYVDGRSAAFLFNRIVEHYNLTLAHDPVGQQRILTSVHSLRTIGSDELFSLLKHDDVRHQRNITSLGNYPVADGGGYTVPIESIPDHLARGGLRLGPPLIRRFQLGMLNRFQLASFPLSPRQRCSMNSLICAAVALGFYRYNNGRPITPRPSTISFYVCVDLLGQQLRARYSGNYIAPVPISVDASRTLPEVAFQIDERVREIRAQGLHLSVFRAMEEATRQPVLRMDDSPLSFAISNWTNHEFLGRAEFLRNCQSRGHFGGFNVNPADSLGAGMINRPMVVINRSVENECCVSIAPCLNAETNRAALMSSIAETISSIACP